MTNRLLVLGTRNRKKGLELRELLAPHGFDLRTLADFPNSVEVDETGTTFAENAALKAIGQAKAIGQWVLGEDSGLCVQRLNREPGVFSARYAGPQASDEENNDKLLRALEGVPLENRGAFYVCHATLSSPDGVVRAESEGECHGRIRELRAGAAGFGYDPLFEVVEYHQTFGELGLAVKGIISHRSRALRQLVPQILALVRRGEWQ